MATPNIVPRSDSEGGLGTASKYWASAYVDNVFVSKIGRDADNLFDFSTDNTVVLRLNGGNELVFNSTQIHPSTNDGLGLGFGARGFSDLFLASGAVINFDNGDIALTHSSNTLEFTGGLMRFADSQKLTFGDSNDLQIHHDGSNSYIQQMNNATGDLIIKQSVDDGDILFQCDDGSGSVTDYIRLDGNAVNIKVYKDIRFQDNEKAEFGTTGDLEIYHSGSHANIINATGNLDIINNADDKDIRFFNDDGSGSITAYITLDGSSTITQVHKNFRFDDNVQLQLGGGSDLRLYHDATDSFIKNSHGNLVLRNVKQNKDVLFQADDGQASDDTIATYFFLDGSSAQHDGSATTALYTNWPDLSFITLGTSHDLQIYHTGTVSRIVNDTGNLEIINNQDDGDIYFKCDDGSGGNETYFFLDGSNTQTVFQKNTVHQDNIEARFGNGADMKIFHLSNQSFIQNQTGNLNIQQYADDSDIIFSSDDGSGGLAEYFKLDGDSVRTTFFKEARFDDSVKAKFGSSGDLEIFHNGTNSSISNFTGHLSISNNSDNSDIIFNCDDGSGGTTVYFKLDGSANTGGLPVTVFPDNSLLWIGTDGGGMRFHADGSNSEFQNHEGDLTIVNNTNDGNIFFKNDNGAGGVATYFKLDGGTSTHDGSSITALYTNWPDNSRISIGSSHDFMIYHDASDTFLRNTVGDLKIRNDANDKDIILQCDDGSGGLAAYITLDGSAGHTVVHKEMQFENNIVARFGNSNAGQIYHSGSVFQIDNIIGDMSINNFADNGDIIFRSDDGSGGDAQYFRVDGGIHEIVFSKSTRHMDNVQAKFGSGEDLKIYHDSNNSYIQNETGNLNLMSRGTDADIKFFSDDGSGGDAEYFKLDGSIAGGDGAGTLFTIWPDNSRASFGDNADLRIYHDGTDTKLLNLTGNVIIQNNANDKDISFSNDDGAGSAITYFRLDGSLATHDGSATTNIHTVFPDLSNVTLGNSQDFSMKHDGTDTIFNNQTGNYVIRNSADDKDILFQCDNGSGGTTEYFRVDGGENRIVYSVSGRYLDNIKSLYGDSQDLQIHHDGTDSFIANLTGDLKISNSQDDGDILFQTDNGSGGVTTYIQLDGSEVSTKILTQKVMIPNLPTSDPSNAGQLWNDSGTLKISAG